MTIARQTFLIQIHEEERLAMVENMGTREVVRLTELAEIGPQIARWMAARKAGEEVDPCRPADDSQPSPPF